MGKKTISLNLDDTGVEDDALISSILTPTLDQDLKGKQPKNKNSKGKKETIENKKTEKPKKTITLDLGEDVKSEIKLSDIEIEKPIKSPPKQKTKKGVDPFINRMEPSKMSKVAKLDDFFNISKDENANSLTHPKTKDYQVGKAEAHIKLQNIQTQIGKLNNKIAKKGRNNVDTKYLDSLDKLLKKEKKYLSILKKFSKNNNTNTTLPTPDVKNYSSNSLNTIRNKSPSTQYSIKKIDNSPPKKNRHLTPKTNNIVSEIDQEMARVNALLDLTEGKNGKYRGITQETSGYNRIQPSKVRVKEDTANKDTFKNVNLQMNLDGVDYLPNMDINQLKRNTDISNRGNGNNRGNNMIKKEVSPPKTMFSVKANLLALKEREKMLARQKRKIQEKLEFKKKQILKAKQQEKEMRKIKALEEEKRRLFELDREVKRLDKLRYQQSLEMKNTMKQMTQKGILTQQNIENIEKEEFQNKQQLQLRKNGYPIYQPFTYNFNTSANGLENITNIPNKNRSNSPTLLTKLHRNMLNMGVGERVLFKPTVVKNNRQSSISKNITKEPKSINKGYRYTRKDYVDSQNSWQDWKLNHLDYFKGNNTNVVLYPYDSYARYLSNYIICKNTDFSDKIISLDNKNNNMMGNNSIIGDNNLLNAYKRDIYQKIPIEDRKRELCQYLAIIKKGNLDTILDTGLSKVLPINKEKNKITLIKIWYSCFEDGKLFISNGNNKIFSQKSQKIEMS